MGNLQKIRSFALITLPLLHWSTAQQTSQYVQRPADGKSQLEDLERDNNANYKSSAADIYPNPSVVQPQSQQHPPSGAYSSTSTGAGGQNQILPIYYASQNQLPLLLTPQQQQQQLQLYQQQHQSQHQPQQPQQQQQQSPVQQQPYIVQPYFNSQPYPLTLDFVNLPLPYLTNLLSTPYITPSSQQQIGLNGAVYLTPSDYYKNFVDQSQSSIASQKTQQQPSSSSSPSSQITSLKSVSPAQSSLYQNYLSPQSLTSQYYYQQQQQSLLQPGQQQQYPSPLYYNTVYQSQLPQKNLYTAGVKSTTPSVPVKKTADSFVQFSDAGYKFEYPQTDQATNFNKAKFSSG